MRLIVTVIALFGVELMECHGQVRPNRPQSVQTSVRVARGKSEMDGKRWTILAVSARSPYQNGFGASVRPELRLECVQQKEETKFLVVLETGPHDYTPNDYDRLRVKLDDNDPVEEGWIELSDHNSWSHEHYPDPTDLKFLMKILSAKSMLIEFHPFMRSGVVESKFDVSGLRREFDKYPECKPRVKPPDPLLDVKDATPAPISSPQPSIDLPKAPEISPPPPPAQPTTTPGKEELATTKVDRPRPVRIEPRIVQLATPTYSLLAKQARVQGIVRLRVIVGALGNVSRIEVISGHPMLFDAAYAAAKKSSFTPGTVDGTATEMPIEVSFSFTLDDENTRRKR